MITLPEVTIRYEVTVQDEAKKLHYYILRAKDEFQARELANLIYAHQTILALKTYHGG